MENNRINSGLSTGLTYSFQYKPVEGATNMCAPTDSFTASTDQTPQKINVDLSIASNLLFSQKPTIEFLPASSFQPMITLDGEKFITTVPRFTATGNVAVGCHNTIFIVNPSDGTEVNKIDMPGDVMSLATADNGTIFACVGKDNGSLVALPDPDKPPAWTFEDGGCKFENVIMGPDKKTLFATGDNNKVYGIDAVTGKKMWDFPMSDRSIDMPSFSPDGTMLYVGAWDGSIYGLTTDKGDKTWEVNTNSVISASPAIDKKGNVIVNSWNGKIRSLDGKTGKQNWENTMEASCGRTPAIGHDGTIFASSEKGKVYAFNPDDGTKKWEKSTDVKFSSSYLGISVLPDNSLLLSGSSDVESKFIVLDPLTGNIRREYTDTDFLALPPAFGSDGTMAISSTEGKTLVFTFERITTEDISTATLASGNIAETQPQSATITYGDAYVNIDGAILNFRHPERWTAQQKNSGPVY